MVQSVVCPARIGFILGISVGLEGAGVPSTLKIANIGRNVMLLCFLNVLLELCLDSFLK